MTYFKKRLLHKQRREKYLTSSYEKLMNNWLKSNENKTNGIKKSKELKLREYFERQFVEIKKAREEKQARKPKAENGESQAEIDSQLEAEQEAENKRMRSLAVIPPILLDNRMIKYKFFNKNGLVLDPVSQHKELQVSEMLLDLAGPELPDSNSPSNPPNLQLIPLPSFHPST